jgi:sarcosine oxidase subunit gamma
LEPVWGEIHGMRVPMHFSDEAAELRQLEHLSLADLSALPKLGVKGPQATSFLESHGIDLPGDLHDRKSLDGNGLVIRVDSSEYFLEEGISDTTVREISNNLGRGKPGAYRVERQETGLLLSGTEAVRVLRQTCAYPFEPGNERFVLTRVALVSCAVLHEHRPGIPFYRIWCAPSSGTYLWETLLRIVQELGGTAVGMSCIQQSEIARDNGSET